MEEKRLETSVRTNGDVPIIDAVGDIDIYTAPVLKETLESATESSLHVVINLSEVSYMDSSGFGTLLSATKRLRPLGGTIRIFGCNEIIERMMEITRLNTTFPIHATEEEAVGAVSEAQAGAGEPATTH